MMVIKVLNGEVIELEIIVQGVSTVQGRSDVSQTGSLRDRGFGRRLHRLCHRSAFLLLIMNLQPLTLRQQAILLGDASSDVPYLSRRSLLAIRMNVLLIIVAISY